MKLRWYAVKKIGLSFFIIVLLTPLLFSQITYLKGLDSTGVKYRLDNAYNLQGLDVKKIGTEKFLYASFDLGNTGRIIKYRIEQNSLVKMDSIELNIVDKHPNDIHIIGDRIYLAAWNGNNISRIVYFDSSNYKTRQEITDTLDKGFMLQFLFFVEGQLFRGITDQKRVVIQKYDSPSRKFNESSELLPSPYRHVDNYIQGAKVFQNKFLLVLTSIPTRIDLYNILGNGFIYIASKNIDFGNFESQGIGILSEGDQIELFIGLGGVNNIVGYSSVFTTTQTYVRKATVNSAAILFHRSDNVIEVTLPNDFNLNPASIYLYNTLGQLVRGKEIVTMSDYKLNVSNLSSGFYIVRILYGGKSVDKKIQVIR